MSRTACLNSIYELAKIDERVVFIGSDLAPNTLANFKEEFPDRFFMAGVQEQSIVGMAAGLAMEGFVVYVNTIATFLTRRAYEQVVLDVCAHNLPVRLIGNGGGLLYAPLGNTHTTGEDIAIMRAIPNMQVICCSDSEEMREFMPETLTNLSPMYIRLGKDTDTVINCCHSFKSSRILRAPRGSKNITICSTGVMTARAEKAADILGSDFDIAIFHFPYVKPLNTKHLDIYSCDADLIVVVEEGIRSGGLGSAILEYVSDSGINVPVLRLGLPDAFPHHYGEQDDLLHTYGLQPEQIAQRIKEAYGKIC